MAYTRHGHHIPGTNRGEGVTKAPAPERCGGVEKCSECKMDMETYLVRFMGEPIDYPAKAKRLVKDHVGLRYLKGGGETPEFEVYVESFTFTLGSYKGYLSTTLDDGLMYQVVYNAEKAETYLVEYRRLAQITIPD